MKMIILEATAEELSANKRVTDALIDALINMCNNISNLPFENLEDEEVNVDE